MAKKKKISYRLLEPFHESVTVNKKRENPAKLNFIDFYLYKSYLNRGIITTDQEIHIHDMYSFWTKVKNLLSTNQSLTVYENLNIAFKKSNL